jgi:ABC-2 type transport system permease protein
MTRYPIVAMTVIGVPVVLLLLFVFVFGETMGLGLGETSQGRADYVNFVTPGILLVAIASSTQGTAISVAMDMNEGIIARFRTMAISRVSVLQGHVLGNLIQTMVGLVVVVGAAFAVGFRPDAGPVEWLAVTGLLTLLTLGLTWLSVAVGLVAKNVESASNLPMPLLILPFLGSGFVPTEGMPTAVRWFAEHQPFTPIMDTVRGLLLGEPTSRGAVAVAWSVVIVVAGYVWAKRIYDRDPVK